MQNEANPLVVLMLQVILALFQLLLLGLQAHLSQRGWTKRNGWHPPGSEKMTSGPGPGPQAPAPAPEASNPPLGGNCPHCHRPRDNPPQGP